LFFKGTRDFKPVFSEQFLLSPIFNFLKFEIFDTKNITGHHFSNVEINYATRWEKAVLGIFFKKRILRHLQ